MLSLTPRITCFCFLLRLLNGHRDLIKGDDFRKVARVDLVEGAGRRPIADGSPALEPDWPYGNTEVGSGGRRKIVVPVDQVDTEIKEHKFEPFEHKNEGESLEPGLKRRGGSRGEERTRVWVKEPPSGIPGAEPVRQIDEFGQSRPSPYKPAASSPVHVTQVCFKVLCLSYCCLIILSYFVLTFHRLFFMLLHI